MASTRGLDEPAAKGLSLTGKPLPHFAEPIRAPIGTTPIRPANSVRRTMSIDVDWPEGVESAGHYHGRARDVRTGAAGSPPELLDDAEIEVVAAQREIRAVSARPDPGNLQDLVGVRAGGYLREALSRIVAQEKAAGTPLYLLLDDLAGTTLVSRWAWSRWPEDGLPSARTMRFPRDTMQGICIGFRPGSGALDEQGLPSSDQNASRVVALPNPDDPGGWHDLPDLGGVNFRRARRIDLWRDGEALLVESHFQDSSSAPDGGDRWAIHEYLIKARIGADGLLKSVEATPGTLPYSPCRAAPVNLEVLLGTPARDLREVVLEKLKFTGGCTHLNDMVRSLAEAPVLAAQLPEA